MKLVIHNSARVWGGNEKWVAAVAGGLAERGHEVVVSCRAEGVVRDRLRAAGVRTTAVRPGAYLDLPRALRFAAWLRRERPDAVLLTSWRETPWGAWAARLAGVPRVVVRLGIVRALERRRHALPFRRWVDALVVNAPEIRREWLRAAPWFPREHVHLVPNGIRRPRVDRAAARARLRALVGAGAETLLIGGAGHVAARKGFDLLLDAFARADVSDSRLVVAGAGPALAGLRARAAELGVAGRVSWLGHQGDVPAVLAGCDLFVLSSRNEGMANVMLEAMSVGTPIVASEVGGVRMALGEEEDHPPAGWIVPREDAARLKGVLREVAGLLRNHPETVRSRVDEAFRRVDERFAMERMIARTEAILFPNAAAKVVREVEEREVEVVLAR